MFERLWEYLHSRVKLITGGRSKQRAILGGLAGLLVVLVGGLLVRSCTMETPNVRVTVDLSSAVGKSYFAPGMSLVEGIDTYDSPSAQRLMGSALTYENVHIMGWGASDPWPDPTSSEPNDWDSLDALVKAALKNGSTPVLTLSEAPWWMKGELQANGTTRVLSHSDEWEPIAYSSRVLDDKMDAWLHLVQRVAERYMAPPYNVRYFQVWNELKGYYNPSTNAYDYTMSAGDPSGDNAKHGYTYMYNQVYDRLMEVAASLGIPQQSIKVGGPYVVTDTYSSPTALSHPSELVRAYGIFDQRPLDVILYWLEHKRGAGFIAVDGSNRNKNHINTVDPFVASEKFADLVAWIRSLDNTVYPGASSLPIWLSEWYVWPYANPQNDDYSNAVKSAAMVEFLKSGGSVALTWGGRGDGTDGTGLWTVNGAGEARPTPWYYSYRDLKRYFSQGTTLYKTTISPAGSIEALASESELLLINKTPKTLKVGVENEIVTLRPYGVTAVPLNH